jgi:PKD repeat protein
MILNILKSLFVSVFCVFLAIGQQTVDPQNCREGESVEYCRQHTILNEMLKNPAFKKQWDKDQAQIAAESAAFAKSREANGGSSSKAVVYRIPVVFHVLHDNGVENISREQIVDALRILNRDYRRLNPDADDVAPAFIGNPADVEVEFVFATIAPNGACFNGITRTQNALTSNGSSGNDQVDAIIAGNDIYNGEWAGNKYLNIFVCKSIGGAAGYTYTPNNWLGSSMKNGIWVLQEYVGSIGTGDENRSRTLTHEVGHWLNLPHVWGGTNNPGLASNCSAGSDDGVADTPETIGNTNCLLTANTCSLDNAYWGFDQIDPVENYMNYSYCSKMFTPGQATRMRNALNSSVGGRNYIRSTTNLIATGADGNAYLCTADFRASAQFVCAGEPVNFEDLSFNNVVGWTWSIPGAIPSTSTDQNPVVTYPTAGTYTVTLTVTDGTTSMTSTKTNYMTVYPAGVVLPYQESFEGYTTLNNGSSFWRPTGVNANSFEITSSAASLGSKSVKLHNYTLPAGTVSELYSNPFDLSALSAADAVTMSFKYAYRKKMVDDFEYLRLSISKDCGDSWVIRKSIIGANLSSETASNDWTPNLSDWVQVHVTGITSTYFVSNLLTKFTFSSGGGNNIFLDQINLYQGGPQNLGVSELADLQNITLYPNPADEELNVRFSTSMGTDVSIDFLDITGKQIRHENIQATAGDNLVLMNTNNLSAGMYFMNLHAGSFQKTIQFVVK